MTGLDESILEFMAALGKPQGEAVVMSPRVVGRNLEQRNLVEKSRSTYSRRMQTLTEAGLLKRLEGKGAHYQITEMGLKYVEGEIGVEDLESLL